MARFNHVRIGMNLEVVHLQQCHSYWLQPQVRSSVSKEYGYSQIIVAVGHVVY